MVLVTGATGLVGSYLCIHLLENELNIRAIYRDEKTIEKTKSIFDLYNKQDLFYQINWIHADLNDIPALENAFANIEYVYHCAALISFDPNEEENLRKINIEGTANIVNLCLANNIKKICHVSSIAALGDLLNHENIIDENIEWNPEKTHSDYAISKYGAEIEVFRAHQEGLNVVVVNPGVILGAGFWESGSGEIFTKVKKGLSFYTNGSSGFVSVNDLVKIMYLLMNSNANGEKFIIISENSNFKSIIYAIANELNVEKPNYEIKKLALNILWRLDWIFNNLFFQKRKLSKDLANSLMSEDLYSNKKIKDLLGFEFEKISKTIENTSKIFNKQKI
jgi:dihydroflavonol-4-reductase